VASSFQITSRASALDPRHEIPPRC
jgi:hypothetical protein